MSERPALCTLVACLLCAYRVELDRHQLASGLPQAHADPDRAVAAGGADLENAFGVGRADQDAQEAAVLL